MDTASFAAVGEEALVGLGAIGGIRPDIAGRIRRIDQPLAQPGTVVGAASVTFCRRIKPCRLSIPMWDL